MPRVPFLTALRFKLMLATLARNRSPRYAACSRDGRLAGRRKAHLSPQEIRERVNQVMDAWQSSPDFAHLFSALLTANDITHRAFAQSYSQATGHPLSETRVSDIAHGNLQPTYAFVSGIADHALLSLGPEGIRPGGQYRTALFAAAGLIEVTPDSIKQWNEEVLANWQRQRTLSPARPPLPWRELMGKLLSFHCQGGRLSQRDIAAAMNALPDLHCQVTIQRCRDILSVAGTVATYAERLALERVAGLDPSQINRIEAAVEDGSLHLGQRPQASSFAALLDDVLGRLRAAGVSQRQLSLRTAPPGQSDPDVSPECLSQWKQGKTRPTLASLRALVHGLERCHDRANRPLVTADEIRNLVSAAGFTREDLAATTHDLVARINGATRLKPLLAALRNAADINIPMSAIDSDIARGNSDTEVRLAHLLQQWESEGRPSIPNPGQVRDILTRYNRLLLAAGKTELAEEEMQKVLEVAQRDRQAGQQHGFLNRLREHHPPTPRRTIRPNLDDGHSR